MRIMRITRIMRRRKEEDKQQEEHLDQEQEAPGVEVLPRMARRSAARGA
jgi:hypothetical protein